MTEHAYDERATNYNTSNHNLFAATNPISGADPVIGGLEVDVVGTGAPVMVQFYCPAMGSSASPPALVTTYFIVNGVVSPSTSNLKNWATGQGEGGSMWRRLVLTNGVSYNIKVGVSAATGVSSACGQASSSDGASGLMFLRVSD